MSKKKIKPVTAKVPASDKTQKDPNLGPVRPPPSPVDEQLGANTKADACCGFGSISMKSPFTDHEFSRQKTEKLKRLTEQLEDIRNVRRHQNSTKESIIAHQKELAVRLVEIDGELVRSFNQENILAGERANLEGTLRSYC